MRTYRIRIKPKEIDDPASYYQITAAEEEAAKLMAILVDQYTSHRPIYPESPIILKQGEEAVIANSYCEILYSDAAVAE